jgi:hypothetical protein
LPSLFSVCGYKVYFWSNEGDEPIHVHISKGSPIPNATKVWITKTGGCIVANNNGHIPRNDLNELLDIVSAQSFYICESWKRFFATEDTSFYC